MLRKSEIHFLTEYIDEKVKPYENADIFNNESVRFPYLDSWEIIEKDKKDDKEKVKEIKMSREEEIRQANNEFVDSPTNLSGNKCDLAQGFAAGAIWADKYPKSLWVSVIDQLPDYEEDVLVAYSEDEMCFNHRTENPLVKTDKQGWCVLGLLRDPICWMRVPKIK